MTTSEETPSPAAPHEVVPTKDQVKTAYGMFLDQGVVGAVALLAIVALIWAIVRLLKSKDDRIKDHALFAGVMQKTNEAMAALTVEVNKSTTAALAETTRSNNAVVVAIGSLEKSMRDLDTKVSSLRDEHVRVVAVLSNTPRRTR